MNVFLINRDCYFL